MKMGDTVLLRHVVKSVFMQVARFTLLTADAVEILTGPSLLLEGDSAQSAVVQENQSRGPSRTRRPHPTII